MKKRKVQEVENSNMFSNRRNSRISTLVYYQLMEAIIWNSIAIYIIAISGCRGSRLSEPQKALGRIEWKEFDTAAIDSAILKNRPTVIFGRPLYHTETYAWDLYFEKNEEAALFHDSNVAAFSLKYDGWYDPQVDKLMSYSEYSFPTKEPLVIIFDRSGKKHQLDYSHREKLVEILGANEKRTGVFIGE